jgi:hypothetical protein
MYIRLSACIEMNKFLGYGLMSIGLLGILFFLKYKGTAIPVKELWFVLSFFTIIIGVYFFAKYKLQQDNRRVNPGNKLAELEQLKLTGDKIRVTLDNAEVKTRSYQQEIISGDLPSRIEIADALYDSNRNYKTEQIQQTYIVFYAQYNGKMCKFISQATAQNAEALKLYMYKQRGIDLYVDPENPINYYFDFPYL